ncbi:uncharacterized protein LOC131937626 [Physella acuta]|uniref:uncharacterized protein LOC131937626 n=1 Tax=Physella acuta TaxID=109671 RepID=UPI0027DC189F|nr:uncharacterized protein LOC131937626 [Physella acuta]
MTSTQTNDLADKSASSVLIVEILPHVNEEMVYKKFSPMGTVTSVQLFWKGVTGNSLRYAYVDFDDAAQAEKAYRSLNYELLEGMPMVILRQHTKEDKLQNTEASGITDKQPDQSDDSHKKLGQSFQTVSRDNEAQADKKTPGNTNQKMRAAANQGWDILREIPSLNPLCSLCNNRIYLHNQSPRWLSCYLCTRVAHQNCIEVNHLRAGKFNGTNDSYLCLHCEEI